jgi:hypothetical protein
MVGTWNRAQTSRVGKADTEDYDDIITEKIIYDLRQWDAIGNGCKVDMRHTSEDFKAFVVVFDLKDDVGGGNVFRPAMISPQEPQEPPQPSRSRTIYTRPSRKPSNSEGT